MAVLAALVILIGTAAHTAPTALDTKEPSARDAAGDSARLAASCQVTQTMGFARCGHSVTRRVALPDALAGADFEAARQYYDLWQIDSFAPEHMEMSREIPLYCPMHQVLTVNEAGEIILTQNAYGDGMAVVAQYEKTVGDFDDVDRDALTLGIGFDSREEAETWLKAH